MLLCATPPLSSDALTVILVASTWTYCILVNGDHAGKEEKYDDTVLSINGLAVYMTISLIVNFTYTTWLKFIHETHPEDRVYTVRQVKKNEDPCGRTIEQLRSLEWHNIGTTLSDYLFAIGSWYLNAQIFWPAFISVKPLNPAAELCYAILHLYILSFFMYWAHRFYHENDFLWKNLHSVHHWAYRPQAHNTFEDHWLENTINALVGNYLAQYLFPLGPTTFHFVRLLRLLESLEKHSGLVGWWNIAYSLQSLFPGSQQPKHHDFHHSGNKCCNYSFSAIGGIWDTIFGTRKEPLKISCSNNRQTLINECHSPTNVSEFHLKEETKFSEFEKLD